MARKFRDVNCVVVEKRFTPAKEAKEYIIDGVKKVIEAQPDKYAVKVPGGVSHSKEMGYEDAYLKTVMVDKDKYDMTKIGDRVECTYDYSTDKDGKDTLRNFNYEFPDKK